MQLPIPAIVYMWCQGSRLRISTRRRRPGRDVPKSVAVEGSRNIKSGSAYPLKVYKQVTKIASHGDGGHMDIMTWAKKSGRCMQSTVL